jgi:hypothetical protein
LIGISVRASALIQINFCLSCEFAARRAKRADSSSTAKLERL